MPSTPPNVAPVWSKAGAMGWATLTAANTARDGTGTVSTVFTADATNGGLVEAIQFVPQGSNVATVARVFVNNGLTNSTAANNSLIAEVSLPLTTASATAALQSIVLPLNIMLPAGYKINVVLGTAVSAGWQATAIGGSY